ncbi:MAG: amino acid decarboxylase [Clostridiales bacterium]|nr:amino acid decarboxylase [Clostridiales bacterium]
MYDSGGDTPLYSALLAHAGQRRASFHTPGHKGHGVPAGEFDFPELDLTELPDTGSLYDGGDAIEQSERLAASAFGAAQTLYSAGGCTLCLQTMLLLGAGPGARVLLARNVHRSVVNTAVLLGLDPVWVWPDSTGRITVGAVRELLSQERGVRAVLITSPDYHGILSDISALSEECRRFRVPLLVDNAHGSHLGAFGQHPLALGASMTADSAHKTLPVLTGGAMLHLRTPQWEGEPSVSRLQAKGAMALFGSTSPSFPVLASLDLAQSWWRREGPAACRRTAAAAAELRALFGQEAETADPLRDPLRLTLTFTPETMAQLGTDGQGAAAFLRRRGCEPELADAHTVVLLLSPFNTQEELTRLSAALQELSRGEAAGMAVGEAPALSLPLDGLLTLPVPERVLSPREAAQRPAEELPLREAAGRVSAWTVCPCPPGVAAVVPGERLGEETLRLLEAGGYTRVVVIR